MRNRRSHRALSEALEPRRLLAAELVISEFLASNDNSIVDNLGNHEDWLEVHNAGDAAANLNDYYLTDDANNLQKWRFPIQSLPAGGYLVVFASDRNLSIAGQELHTNFKLGASGEYLGLIRAADGAPQFEYAPAFPPQSADISYGLLDDDDPLSTRVFFSTPTPGAMNVPTVEQPVFSEPGRTFTGTLSVAISSPTPGAQIRYTTNGTQPTGSSALYTAPISVSTTTVVRARAFAAGFFDSPIVSRSYIAVDASVTTFESNLPIVVIDTFNTALNDTTLVPAAATFIDTAAGGRAQMLGTPDFDGRIGIRIRGSTSSQPTYLKKQFAVELWDENNADKKLPLLGLPAESDWILYAPYSEKSLMQNALAMKWANEQGRYASRTRFVEVYLNTDGGTSIGYNSDYWGVYILMEKIKGGEDRVNIAKMQPSDSTGDAVTGGYIFKKDRIEITESTFTTTGGQTYVNVEPDETEITAAQKTYITGYMNQFEAALFGPNFTDPVNGYSKFIDVDSWIDFWLVNEMTKNIDAFWLSTFFHKDRGGKVAMGPVWDFNLSLGQANYRNGASAMGWMHESLTSTQYFYFPRLFQDPAFKLRLVDRWQELRRTVYSTDAILSAIDANVATLSDHNGNYPVGTVPTQPSNNPVVRNFKRWNVLGTYTPAASYYDPQGRWIEDVSMMKQWITARVKWIDSQFVPAPLLSPPGGNISTTTPVSITPQAQAAPVDTTILAPGAPARAFVPSANIAGWQNLGYSVPAGWLSGTTGVGYDTTSSPVNYLPLIGLNVGAPMQNVRTSIFIRVEFNVPDPASVGSLILKMKYDDGFFAWINGVRVIEANAPENVNPVFSTAAVGARDENAALQYVEFDISAARSQLVAGTNVLAIQAMNNTVGSNDLLIVPELVSRQYVSAATGAVYYTTDGSDPRSADGLPAASATAYAAPLTFAANTRLRARTLIGSDWSGDADAIYTVAANTLAITEIMYNPPAGGTFAAQDYEFVEVLNHGDEPLELGGFSLAEGITFAFPSGTLDAGAHGVIVKSLAAFQSRYGSALNVLGTFTGSLDNGGERLRLVSPQSESVQDFTYDDVAPWPVTPDGGGPSLEIIDPQGNAADPANWRASNVFGGSPGAAPDFTPPVALDAQFDVDGNRVLVRFSENVQASLAPGDLQIEPLPAGTPVLPVSVSYDALTNTAAFVLGGSIPDVNFRLRLLAGSIADPAGNVLVEVVRTDPTYYALAGDANRDRVVGIADFARLASGYNLPGLFSQGDFNYSGIVDLADFSILAARYGADLPEAAGALARTTDWSQIRLRGSPAALPVTDSQRSPFSSLGALSLLEAEAGL